MLLRTIFLWPHPLIGLPGSTQASLFSLRSRSWDACWEFCWLAAGRGTTVNPSSLITAPCHRSGHTSAELTRMRAVLRLGVSPLILHGLEGAAGLRGEGQSWSAGDNCLPIYQGARGGCRRKSCNR